MLDFGIRAHAPDRQHIIPPGVGPNLKLKAVIAQLRLFIPHVLMVIVKRVPLNPVLDLLTDLREVQHRLLQAKWFLNVEDQVPPQSIVDGALRCNRHSEVAGCYLGDVHLHVFFGGFELYGLELPVNRCSGRRDHWGNQPVDNVFGLFAEILQGDLLGGGGLLWVIPEVVGLRVQWKKVVDGDDSRCGSCVVGVDVEDSCLEVELRDQAEVVGGEVLDDRCGVRGW